MPIFTYCWCVACICCCCCWSSSICCCIASCSTARWLVMAHDIDDGISMTTTSRGSRANRNAEENSLPGEENILIRGVNSEGLLR
jgi:hypothetical protein